MRRQLKLALRFMLVATFALWVPLGPCVTIAAAWIDAKPCCQAKSRKVSCHKVPASEQKESARPDCKCHRQLEIKSGRCPCGHDSADLILGADPARLATTITVARAQLVTRAAAPTVPHQGVDRTPESPPPISTFTF